MLKATLMATQVKLKSVNIHFHVLEVIPIQVTIKLKNLNFVERNNMECNKTFF